MHRLVELVFDRSTEMLHRHANHGEAVARIGWCVTERTDIRTGMVSPSGRRQGSASHLHPGRIHVQYSRNTGWQGIEVSGPLIGARQFADDHRPEWIPLGGKEWYQ